MPKVVICLCLVMAGLTWPALTAAEDNAAPQEVETVMVRLDYINLFPVRGIRAFPAEDRAQGIVDRIVAAADDRNIDVNSITVVEGVIGSDIMAGDDRLLTLLDADGELEGLAKEILAQVYAEKIKTAITEYRYQRNPETIIGNVIRSLIATLVTLVALFLLLRLFRFIIRKLELRYKRSVRDHRLPVLPTAQGRSGLDPFHRRYQIRPPDHSARPDVCVSEFHAQFFPLDQPVGAESVQLCSCFRCGAWAGASSITCPI